MVSVKTCRIYKCVKSDIPGMLIFVEALRMKTSILAGALTLAVMTLPIIIRTTQEALKTVPDSYREGAKRIQVFF